jgi:hypothetical protein
MTMMASNNWKMTTYLAGGVIGLLTGLAAAHLYARAAEENNAAGALPAKIETADAFKLGLALVALIRQITDLGARRPDSER